MPNIITIAFLTIAALGLTPSPGVAQDSTERAPVRAVADSSFHGTTIVLHVDGLSCPFCAYGLEKRIRELAAVDSAVVRLAHGIVLIRTKPEHELADETIVETVRRSGFSLREIQRLSR